MKRILVVDDQIDIQEMLADILRNKGHEVSACSNGRQALDFLKQKYYDLIITDLLMPQQNGFEFIASVRQKHSMPILVITGGGSNSDHYLRGLEDLKSKNYQILQKPFTPAEFMNAVDAHLSRVRT